MRARWIAPRDDNAAWGQLLTRPVTLAEILAGRVALADCALIYAPSVAENLPDNTLAQLIEALVPSLRPFGEIVIPAFTRLPEPGLLELAAEWEPNTRSLSAPAPPGPRPRRRHRHGPRRPGARRRVPARAASPAERHATGRCCR